MPIESSGSRWPARSPGVAQLAQPAECPALLGRVVGQRAHRHEPRDLEARRSAASASSSAGRPSGSTPPFCGSSLQLTWTSTGLPLVRRDPPIELGGQVRPVHRMDQGEPPRRVAGLVPLQRADQMPGDRDAGRAPSCFSSASWTRFSPTSASPAASAARTASGPWVLVTATIRTGWVHPADGLVPGHGLTYPGEAAGEGREVHSLGIYLRLGGYCRGGQSIPRACSVVRVTESTTARRAARRSGLGGERWRHSRSARSHRLPVAPARRRRRPASAGGRPRVAGDAGAGALELLGAPASSSSA